jgi:hypothetical protein
LINKICETREVTRAGAVVPCVIDRIPVAAGGEALRLVICKAAILHFRQAVGQ